MTVISATDSDFEDIFRLARDVSGIVLTQEKVQMVNSRLRPRLRSLNLTSMRDYYELVSSKAGEHELSHMISALTTNVSHFFRENHHFEHFSAHIEKKIRDQPSVRVWSAGCSNGQEPYSIAISSVRSAAKNVKILATDIDTKVLSFAMAGCYPENMRNGLEKDLQTEFFNLDLTQGVACAKEAIRSPIVFKHLNLLSDWPMKKTFDFIFCRNVLIYFEPETQDKLWPRFANQLGENGVLYLGHSERITNPSVYGLRLIGPTTYEKIA